MTNKKTKALPLPISNIKKCLSHPFYSTMTERAQTTYKNKCRELIGQNALSETYLDMLILYAKEFDKLLSIDEQLATEGDFVTFTDRYGSTRTAPHPLCKIRKDTMTNLVSIGRQFGYNPKDSGVDLDAIRNAKQLEELEQKLLGRHLSRQ